MLFFFAGLNALAMTKIYMIVLNMVHGYMYVPDVDWITIEIVLRAKNVNMT